MHYAPAFVQEEKISMGGIKALDEEPASVDGSRLLQEPAPVFDAFACAAATYAPARNMKALQGLGLGNDLTLHYAPWLFAFPVDRFSQLCSTMRTMSAVRRNSQLLFCPARIHHSRAQTALIP